MYSCSLCLLVWERHEQSFSWSPGGCKVNVLYCPREGTATQILQVSAEVHLVPGPEHNAADVSEG